MQLNEAQRREIGELVEELVASTIMSLGGDTDDVLEILQNIVEANTPRLCYFCDGEVTPTNNHVQCAIDAG